jgi:hypothetical protein
VSVETEPLFEVKPAAPDPLAVRIARMVPQASRVQVRELAELVAAEAEAIARPPKRRNTLGPTCRK